MLLFIFNYKKSLFLHNHTNAAIPSPPPLKNPARAPALSRTRPISLLADLLRNHHGLQAMKMTRKRKSKIRRRPTMPSRSNIAAVISFSLYKWEIGFWFVRNWFLNGRTLYFTLTRQFQWLSSIAYFQIPSIKKLQIV